MPAFHPYRRQALQVIRQLCLASLYAIVLTCAAAWADEANLGGSVGEIRRYEVSDGDTFAAIAQEHGLGFIELVAANPNVDPWVPGPGTLLILPSAHLLPTATRAGIVVNLAEQRLYYFADGGADVMTYPIGTGRAAYETPVGKTRVIRKRENPTWSPPASIRAEQPHLPQVVPPGPDNPLGALALDLDWSSYLIHGTSVPLGVGRRVSHGCIRLKAADMRSLYAAAPVGTPVNIVDQPLKLARIRGELYIEVHPTQAQGDELEASGSFAPVPGDQLVQRLRDTVGPQAHRLDWTLVARAIRERRGIPIRVSR